MLILFSCWQRWMEDFQFRATSSDKIFSELSINNKRVAENCVALNIYEHVSFPPPRHETSKTIGKNIVVRCWLFSFASFQSREKILCCRSKCETSHKPSPSDCLIFYEWKFFFFLVLCVRPDVCCSISSPRSLDKLRRWKSSKGNGRRYRGINKFAGRASFLLIFRRTKSFRFSFRLRRDKNSSDEFTFGWKSQQ